MKCVFSNKYIYLLLLKLKILIEYDNKDVKICFFFSKYVYIFRKVIAFTHKILVTYFTTLSVRRM